ncbi:glycosyltransferase family protein [Ruegeria arenilitoris]|uniref:Undecaprenyldiphospho-muramoylpentapeptide beta-N- acetylglucosaminyltransferase n=1 Tax=Ruegeria arenilitoris TaxID=1173585 RepID=A0A238KWR9_9RHOB|nr:glycosyltransferase [Ruegeria arenilitoris]SMX47284.1 undecaprenyldiphospho-muramoylpentapeptide beta-N- acetylglucosaminyltransferase [Ruegeria arenilitoris]
MRTMIVVTHLLGTGHLSRALTLGRAFADAGHDVTVASGGMPAPQLNTDGVSLLALPPLRSDGTDFTRLLTADGNIADATYLNSRAIALTEAVRRVNPDVLITELYPFGRRSLADEFLALLSTARSLPYRPVVLSSIRDILAPPSKPAKAARTEEIIERFYDGVLVHSDPEITPLDASWPVTDNLAGRLFYTGFVAPPAPKPHEKGEGANEILVSAGGGSVGQPIFRAAIEAAQKMPNRRWRLLVGGQDAEDRITELRRMTHGENVILEPVRPDFRQMLPLAAASVSMCGYNTAMDLLQCAIPAVLIPFDDGKEVEQTLRANSLARLPAVDVLPSAKLTRETLAQALDRVLHQGPRKPLDGGFDGARKSVEIATSLWEARQ